MNARARNADRNSVRSRLAHWGRWIQEPRHDITRSVSPSGNLVDQRNAAGSRGKGLHYDTLIVDGDAVQCRPDGGLSREVERRANVIAHNMRCIETHRAICDLPDEMRRAVIDKYVVRHGARPGSPRSNAEVARRLGKSESTIHESLESAYTRLSERIYGRFEVLEDADEQDQAA